MSSITITLNGEDRQIIAGQNVTQVISGLHMPPQGVAVALNGKVIPRSAWDSTPVPDRSLMDLVTAMQGG